MRMVIFLAAGNVRSFSGHGGRFACNADLDGEMGPKCRLGPRCILYKTAFRIVCRVDDRRGTRQFRRPAFYSPNRTLTVGMDVDRYCLHRRVYTCGGSRTILLEKFSLSVVDRMGGCCGRYQSAPKYRSDSGVRYQRYRLPSAFDEFCHGLERLDL